MTWLQGAAGGLLAPQTAQLHERFQQFRALILPGSACHLRTEPANRKCPWHDAIAGACDALRGVERAMRDESDAGARKVIGSPEFQAQADRIELLRQAGCTGNCVKKAKTI